MTNSWSVAPGTLAVPSPTHPFMETNNLTRGLAYNPVSGNVLVVSRFGSNAVHVLNGATGAKTGNLPYNTGVIAGGTFPVNLVGVADDGVIYVCNLTTDSTNVTPSVGPFRLYRWANESTQPELAFSGDPTFGNTLGTNPRRVGDSMAVRGSGTGTQVLLGTYNQFVYVLTTTDGTNFTSRKIATDITASDSRWGVAWGAGNTFWVKQSSGNLKKLNLDLVNNTATVVGNYPLAVSGGPLGIDLARNLLAIVDTAGHKLRLYDISDPLDPLLQDTIKNFPGTNANANFTGAVGIRDGKLFALESNNGILGAALTEVYVTPTITSAPGNVSIWDGASSFTFSVVAAGTRPYQYQWLFNGSAIPAATNRTYTLTNITSAQIGGYTIVVSNTAGSSSATAQMNILPSSASSKVQNIWNVAPDTRPYLTSGYKEYGVAINPATTNVLVLTRLNPTNMLAVLDGFTGAEKHYIDLSGLPLNGGTPMNKMDIADDGAIYIANFTSTPATVPFTILGIGSDVPNTTDKWMAYAGNPGPGLAAADNVWGRTLAVRGGALETEILVGSASSTGKAVAIFKPDPTYAFTPTIITIPDAPAGFCRLGIAWGPGANTFWAKSVGSLTLVEFDLSTGTGFVRKSYPITGLRSVPDSVTGISYDPANKLFAGLRNGLAIRPVSVPVFDMADVETGPVELDLELFTTQNADIEFQGQTDFANGYLVALGVNNGVKMFQINNSAANAPYILTHPLAGTNSAGGSTTLSAVADSNSALTYQWYFNGAPIQNATDASLTLSNLQLTNAGSYFVRVSTANGGTRDSAVAIITVISDLKILNVTAANGQITIEWQAQSGTVYQVQSVNSLTDTWQDLGSPVTATGSTASYVDTLPNGAGQRFYRIVVR
jgi:hypothetical protein